MSMSTSLPYEGSATENLTLSDPRCTSDACKAFYDGHQLSQKLVSYYRQYDYGHYVTWFYLACIGLATFTYAGRRMNEARRSSGHNEINVCPKFFKNKIVALWRAVAYRRWPGKASDRFGLPSFGMLIFMTLVLLYLLLLTFWARPYYRLYRGWGSPPIGVRTGLMAIATTPLIVALSGKANLITMLTGIGHEKLNIFHRWVGWFTFILSVAHTVPFIVAPLQMPFGGAHALHMQYYKKGGFEYTGTPPLGILFGLLLLSVPYIRHRLYEVFYHLHFWLAVSYVGLMFWHAGNLGDSWAYLWATLAVWLLSILMRTFYFNQPTSILSSEWGIGSPLTSHIFLDNMTRLEILAPPNFHWKPGQHVFLRIPALNIVDNHPFTIATADALSKDDAAQQKLHMYIRSYAGFTRRLRRYIEKSQDAELEAWIDGPYGGHHRDLSLSFDRIILVAGGGGISAILPWLEYITLAMKSSRMIRTTSVEVHWSIRHSASFEWIADKLEELDLGSLSSRISMSLYITGDEAVAFPEKTDTDIEAVSAPKNKFHIVDKRVSQLNIHTQAGRVDMNRLFDAVEPGSKSVVVCCGPESLKVALSNACAAAQTIVLRGQAEEIALQSETFGW